MCLKVQQTAKTFRCFRFSVTPIGHADDNNTIGGTHTDFLNFHGELDRDRLSMPRVVCDGPVHKLRAERALYPG